MSFPLVDYGSGESSDEEQNSANETTKPIISVSSTQQNFFSTSAVASSSDEEQTADDQRETTLTSKSAELKNPFRSSGGPASVSVFSNPFKEAEDAEKSSLEKHVKLAPKIEDVREINGRRICWNYRKGRCRFGSKCIYAHDSELLQKKEEPVNYEQSTVASQGFDDKKASQVTNKRPAFGSKTIPSKKSKGPVK